MKLCSYFIFYSLYNISKVQQNYHVGVLGMVFRARKFFGTFERQGPEHDSN